MGEKLLYNTGFSRLHCIKFILTQCILRLGVDLTNTGHLGDFADLANLKVHCLRNILSVVCNLALGF
jgi:hypothetical protein